MTQEDKGIMGVAIFLLIIVILLVGRMMVLDREVTQLKSDNSQLFEIVKAKGGSMHIKIHPTGTTYWPRELMELGFHGKMRIEHIGVVAVVIPEWATQTQVIKSLQLLKEAEEVGKGGDDT